MAAKAPSSQWTPSTRIPQARAFYQQHCSASRRPRNDPAAPLWQPQDTAAWVPPPRGQQRGACHPAHQAGSSPAARSPGRRRFTCREPSGSTKAALSALWECAAERSAGQRDFTAQPSRPPRRSRFLPRERQASGAQQQTNTQRRIPGTGPEHSQGRLCSAASRSQAPWGNGSSPPAPLCWPREQQDGRAVLGPSPCPRNSSHLGGGHEKPPHSGSAGPQCRAEGQCCPPAPAAALPCTHCSPTQLNSPIGLPLPQRKQTPARLAEISAVPAAPREQSPPLLNPLLQNHGSCLSPSPGSRTRAQQMG